jgi:hypothetical protein
MRLARATSASAGAGARPGKDHHERQHVQGNETGHDARRRVLEEAAALRGSVGHVALNRSGRGCR